MLRRSPDRSVSSTKSLHFVFTVWCGTAVDRLCGQSSWLQIQGSRIRFPALPEQKVMGLERGPLSLVSTTEELLDRKVAAPV
jgi:hypothetical protein